jgi:Pentapeptide repeats (8 copies)
MCSSAPTGRNVPPAGHSTIRKLSRSPRLAHELDKTARAEQRAKAERELAEHRAQDEALQAYLDQMSQLMLDRKLLDADQGAPVYPLAQARTSTIILRLDAEHNESVTRFLIDSGLAVSSEASSARILRGITLSHATLSDAVLDQADLSYADLSGADLNQAGLSGADLRRANLRGATALTNEKIAVAESLEGATMPDGQKYEDWLKSKDQGENK